MKTALLLLYFAGGEACVQDIDGNCAALTLKNCEAAQKQFVLAAIGPRPIRVKLPDLSEVEVTGARCRLLTTDRMQSAAD